jgi:hypothetical protein
VVSTPNSYSGGITFGSSPGSRYRTWDVSWFFPNPSWKTPREYLKMQNIASSLYNPPHTHSPTLSHITYADKSASLNKLRNSVAVNINGRELGVVWNMIYKRNLKVSTMVIREARLWNVAVAELFVALRGVWWCLASHGYTDRINAQTNWRSLTYFFCNFRLFGTKILMFKGESKWHWILSTNLSSLQNKFCLVVSHVKQPFCKRVVSPMTLLRYNLHTSILN